MLSVSQFKKAPLSGCEGIFDELMNFDDDVFQKWMAAENPEGGVGKNGRDTEWSSEGRHDESSDPRTTASSPWGREGQKAGMIDAAMLVFNM